MEQRYPVFGYVILGLPGSGKTTLVKSLREVFQVIGRPVRTVNLDFSNQLDQEPFDFDCRDIIQTIDVQELVHLGPNGGLLYCLDYFWKEENRAQLLRFVSASPRSFLLFDLPGQIECYVAHPMFRNLFREMTRLLNAQLVVIGLTDVSTVASKERYLQFELNGICIGYSLQLPFINALNKADLLPEGSLQRAVDQHLCQLRESSNELTAALVRQLDGENAGPYCELSALDSKSVVRLVNRADDILGYARGMCGEFAGKGHAEIRRAEQFMEISSPEESDW